MFLRWTLLLLSLRVKLRFPEALAVRENRK